jgi:ParB family chromosome partitioning protein
MARVTEYREIELEKLEIGKGQARQRVSDRGIPELAESIAKQGLLQPILVSPSGDGRYEILIGQRRFLAHQQLLDSGKLDRPVIMAAVLDERVDEAEAKAVSLTENLLREGLSQIDTIDACTYLYKKYGTVKAVAQATGISDGLVGQYVKYPQLIEGLKELVDEGSVKVETALRAQRIAGRGGEVDAEAAVELAKEMSGMSGAQQKKLASSAEEKPDADASDLIEDAKTGAKIQQIVVTLTATAHGQLQRYASDLGSTQDDAAGTLIETALAAAGYAAD